MTTTLDSNTLPAWLAAWDKGKLNSEDTVRLFQYLIDEYIVWGMGNEYVGMAEFLVQAGYCLLGEKEREAFGVPVPYCELQCPVEEGPRYCAFGASPTTL